MPPLSSRRLATSTSLNLHNPLPCMLPTYSIHAAHATHATTPSDGALTCAASPFLRKPKSPGLGEQEDEGEEGEEQQAEGEDEEVWGRGMRKQGGSGSIDPSENYVGPCSCMPDTPFF